MQVDYISDLHLDFYIRMNSNEKKYREQTRNFCESLLPNEKGKVLVIAGDISHYNRQSKYALEFFSEQYDKVLFTLGNHDYYLISSEQEKRYNHNSMNREMELVAETSFLHNVVFLRNFEVLEYEGVRFAGATNWYPLEDVHEKSFFYNMSNDSRLIKDLDIAQLSSMTTYKYEQMEEVDVLVTHVPTIQIQSHVKYNSYYCYLNRLIPKAKHNIFGHCHEQSEYNKAEYKFYINALGYPEEYLRHINPLKYAKAEREEFRKQWMKIKSFEV